ncbi:hypothetical protein CB0940_08194 [Cercospora beticola]|uniref:Uncharacterized protein n=1 Tax=Cercospora beticola TaxID=122368 RepID=A0A2G5HQJ4_CERBT|nr:hypothetical protein CB0940_08194 [Cercospora beticola]PIA94800.1 hypothetical protein CB0940_08194 [Cercospora beticola]
MKAESQRCLNGSLGEPSIGRWASRFSSLMLCTLYIDVDFVILISCLCARAAAAATAESRCPWFFHTSGLESWSWELLDITDFRANEHCKRYLALRYLVKRTSPAV